ncbi:DUF3325 domain-containing protein [Hydrogenophaga sp.]|uniref:DUF3325 domain-containing protein n=1 Tax=Hydrogenophaga sp. TaxID=1904254 RepID=UPI002FCA70A0
MTSVHLGILLIGLLGFFALALVTEHCAERLLRRVPTPSWRLLSRSLGWGLLALSLSLAIARLNAGVGITLWLGWLSIAALALVFGLPKWPWQPPVRARRARAPKATEATHAEPGPIAPRRPIKRWTAAALLLAVPLVYGLALRAVPVKPLLRADAVDGHVGPWTFRLAETEQRAPDLVAMGIPMKAYQVRFCEDCDLDIRSAYLKVNKPRSLRAAGIVLSGTRWERRVDIQLPANTTAESELWLTVVGKDGAVHQATVRMSDVSPSTVAWFEQREGGRAAREPEGN